MNNEEKGYVIPFAKGRGLTSFSALSVIKRRLALKKVGHTGTLDSFADGLLVVVTGNLTRLAPFIEAKTKKYEALISFGSETDTLDILGKPILEAPLPTYKDIEKVIPTFIGSIMQEPPKYSALHVKGRRASDIVRAGGAVELNPRNVYIEEISIKGILFDDECSDKKDVWIKDLSVKENKKLYEKKVKLAHVNITCSKGTYVRSLARDIAKAVGSASHLKALRRLCIGPFKLEDAFGAESLPPFLSEDNKNIEYLSEIGGYLKSFSKELCNSLELFILEIKEGFVAHFLHGKNIKDEWFYNMEEKRGKVLQNKIACVFYHDKVLGIIEVQNKNYKYKAVF